MMTQTSVVSETGPLHVVKRTARDTPPQDLFYTAPLVPMRHPQPVAYPLCDVNLIMERLASYQLPAPEAPSVTRPDSQVLPIGDINIPPSAFVDYAFINFEPTYKVTVSEVDPYRLTLRKPRTERLSRSIVSFLTGDSHGKIRLSSAVHFEE